MNDQINQYQDRETTITMLAGPQLPPGVWEQEKKVREMMTAFVEYYRYSPEFELDPIEREGGSRLTLFHAKVFDADRKPITAARFAQEHRLWIALTEFSRFANTSEEASRALADLSYRATVLVDDPDQILGTPEPGVPPTPPGGGGPGWEAKPIKGPLPPLYFDFPSNFNPSLLGLSSSSIADKDVNIFVVDNCAIMDEGFLVEMLDRFQTKNPVAAEMLGAITSTTERRLYFQNKSNIPTSTPSTPLVDGIDWHGLFIVGILLSLTKRAQIFLIPEIDEYGYTSLQRVVDGLHDAVQGRREPALINLSLTFRGRAITPSDFANVMKMMFASPEQPEWIKYINNTTNSSVSPFDQSGYDDAYSRFLVGEWDIKDHLVGPYTRPNSNYANKEMQIIAATGNMRDTSDLPLREEWPGYPARVSSVLAVGALDMNHAQTDYSQLREIPDNVRTAYPTLFPDNPIGATTGVNTFGGNKDIGSGIKGLFLGGTILSNSHGLAEWSGTSFATAVITGLLARMIETGQTLEDAKNRLLTAKNIPLLQTSATRPNWLKN